MIKAAALLSFLALSPVTLALKMQNAVSTTTVLEQPADFSAGKMQGLILSEGRVKLAPNTQVGTLSGTVSGLSAYDELIPSWNALTPPGSSLTLEVKPAGASRFYSFGTWQSAAGRSSLDGQKDSFGQVLTDTLRLSKKVSGFDYRLTLMASGAGPSLSLLAFNTSDRSRRMAAAGAAGDKTRWNKVLNVPLRSQMLYKDGGEVWCSPTSISMILAYNGVSFSVPDAAAATYDTAYDGTGNWPFNTAFAAEQGLRALVTRLPNLREAERYIAAGFPLGVSLGWKAGELPGAAIPSSSGHLMVLVGFDAQGNPVLNDPAAPTNAGVRRSYPRAAFERLWLSHSGGLVYLISKPDQALPPTVPSQ
ncbi:peptidase C39 family protein [Deinococcus detaillensis]|uniref:Peptidase C39 family protein n=1 Tax=Deinococcus detaillensis TaxID=2592048 RepID=A0A553UJG4_9DEIO|nr:peptidase C39 family protein [Deinococcus detaillensis]TSA80320.1 peptidase C39 family protein [Deinococcus detaillensis]